MGRLFVGNLLPRPAVHPGRETLAELGQLLRCARKVVGELKHHLILLDHMLFEPCEAFLHTR